MNLKIEIAENWILLDVDVIFLGTCSGSEVAGLDLDEGGWPGLVERERPWEMDGSRVWWMENNERWLGFWNFKWLT